MSVKIGTKVDQLYKLREDIAKEKLVVAKASKRLDTLQKRFNAKEEELFDKFTKEELEGASGKVAKCGVSRREHPAVKSWPKFYAWIKRNNAFDCLQRRASAEACRARWEDKKTIPGVSKFTKLSLSLTKK